MSNTTSGRSLYHWRDLLINRAHWEVIVSELSAALQARVGGSHRSKFSVIEQQQEGTDAGRKYQVGGRGGRIIAFIQE